MINMALRTGLMRTAAGNDPSSFRDVMQMAPQEAAALQAKPTTRQRAAQLLGRMKQIACVPIAVAAYPYIRLRGYKGPYCICWRGFYHKVTFGKQSRERRRRCKRIRGTNRR